MKVAATKRNKQSSPAAPIKYRRPRRIDQWVEETKTSRATTWRRVRDGTLQITYLGDIPFITGGPPGFEE
jgi:hypothetical protein